MSMNKTNKKCANLQEENLKTVLENKKEQMTKQKEV